MAFVYVKITFSQSNGHNFFKISGQVRYQRPTPQKASKRAAIALWYQAQAGQLPQYAHNKRAADKTLGLQQIRH